MVIRRGEIWWADLGVPRRSEPGFTRPVLIVSSDAYNASKINTVIVLVVTSNTKLASAPGNVLLTPAASHLPKPSVVNVSHAMTLDKSFLSRRVTRLSKASMHQVEDGLRAVFDLP